jgi:hypothetical protein
VAFLGARVAGGLFGVGPAVGFGGPRRSSLGRLLAHIAASTLGVDLSVEERERRVAIKRG